MTPILGDIGLFQTHDCESWHRASSNGVASTLSKITPVRDAQESVYGSLRGESLYFVQK